jgi:hypothetical protein
MAIPGRLAIHREGKPVALYAVHPDGGVFGGDEAVGLTFTFSAPTQDPPPTPPPRELESMSTAEVAEYLAKRLRDEADERRMYWDD